MNEKLPWERKGVVCTDEELLTTGKSLIRMEAQELLRTANEIGNELTAAARAIFECRGRTVVVGMGKSGHIGRKISATLASLGTPSLFLHAAEGAHGDLGMVRREDIGIFLSNSGTTSETLALLPHFKRIGAMLIAITGDVHSPLAQHSDIILNSHVKDEADPLHLAPTSSTTLQLAIGDALAAMVTQLRGLNRDDFAAFHPGGTLGRKLLTKVRDVMGTPEQLPAVHKDVSLENALFEITSKKYGATCILDENGNLAGIFTDGDLRRVLEKYGVEALNRRLDSFMTAEPLTITEDRLAAEAVKIMEERAISVLVVVDGKKPVGMLHLYELLKAGFE